MEARLFAPTGSNILPSQWSFYLLAGCMPVIVPECSIKNSLPDLIFQHETQVKMTLSASWIPLLCHSPVVSSDCA